MLIWMRIGWMLQKYYYTRKLGIEASITRGARRVIAGISVVLVQIVATEYTLAAWRSDVQSFDVRNKS